MPDNVKVEQTQRLKRKKGMQPRARVSYQQFVLPDLEYDARAGNGIVRPEKYVFSHIRNRHLHRHRQGVHHCAG